MTQEEKKLLLKDLCARLPYGVKVQTEVYNTVILEPFYLDQHEWLHPIAYLRPMSSIASLISAKEWTSLSGIDLIDWYNANHIDYRGLIEKGLALEAPEGMYDLKEK